MEKNVLPEKKLHSLFLSVRYEKGNIMKYLISATISPYGEQAPGRVYKHDPEKAIKEWCRVSEKYPTCASIQPETKEDGQALLKWALNNFDTVKTYMREYKVPYKPEWIEKQLRRYVEANRNSMMWSYDEIFPFCMG